MKTISRIIKPFGALALALGLGLSGAGCSEYKYFDISVGFDPAYPSTAAAEVKFCKVTVSGADSSEFRIGNCPPANHPLNVGVFTFSSFADSGTMNFKLDAYTSVNERAECISGSGTASVPVTGQTTILGTLVIKRTAPGCTNVTPPNDGGI
jgi:hypothetical protein